MSTGTTELFPMDPSCLYFPEISSHLCYPKNHLTPSLPPHLFRHQNMLKLETRATIAQDNRNLQCSLFFNFAVRGEKEGYLTFSNEFSEMCGPMGIHHGCECICSMHLRLEDSSLAEYVGPHLCPAPPCALNPGHKGWGWLTTSSVPILPQIN